VQRQFIRWAYDPTIEDSYKKTILVDGVEVSLDILDMAEQDDFKALRQTYMRTARKSEMPMRLNNIWHFWERTHKCPQIVVILELDKFFSTHRHPAVEVESSYQGRSCTHRTESSQRITRQFPVWIRGLIVNYGGHVRDREFVDLPSRDARSHSRHHSQYYQSPCVFSSLKPSRHLHLRCPEDLSAPAFPPLTTRTRSTGNPQSYASFYSPAQLTWRVSRHRGRSPPVALGDSCPLKETIL
jgi:hypothetical protein